MRISMARPLDIECLTYRIFRFLRAPPMAVTGRGRPRLVATNVSLVPLAASRWPMIAS